MEIFKSMREQNKQVNVIKDKVKERALLSSFASNPLFRLVCVTFIKRPNKGPNRKPYVQLTCHSKTSQNCDTS